MAIKDVALAGLTREQLLHMHYLMLLVRRFEEKAGEEYTLGKIGGFLHLYIGQEAIAVGALTQLRKDDYVAGNYREHGHAIIKGVDPRHVMAELFGRIDGCSKGRGGSMHIFDASVGMIGGQAIVAAQLPIATGLALAAQYQKQDKVAVAVFGDGAVDEGAFHESLNLAALWKLPVIFLCENNQYSMGMSVRKAWSIQSLEPRAAAYGMPYMKLDGMDTIDVYTGFKEALERARAGNGPTLIEAVTYRFRGHSVADPAKYRPKTEEEEWRSTRDPIAIFENKLLETGLVRQEELKAADEKANEVVEDAVKFADASPFPTIDDLYDNVMVDGSGAIAWREKHQAE